MLKLVPLSVNYKLLLEDMMNDWTATGETIVPSSIARVDYHNFKEYMHALQQEQQGLPGRVPATTLFALDVERNIFVGAVNIRHELNDYLLSFGGHIGDGVRPTERRKGYATEMIALALEECRSMGIDKVLMTCDKDNIGSAKSIRNNGGVLENEVNQNGELVQRYWIDLQ